ncbi:hypothetical protein OM416_20025 [Paenibacillus sp. LS1]|uniref:hypothetical protein n=1 Tax=Paenibacillus sp. LS1 TaxID=2992120 RepID=UPI00222FAF57|nr:hypothetical protein [Paenibacillus sp. LS1]MCW3793884.1 hypothetical protein [Paenibacillus sp. LS1]
MTTSQINFSRIANILGLEEAHAEVFLAIPPLVQESLFFRVQCFSELLLQFSERPPALRDQWAEVKSIQGQTNEETCVLIQFSSMTEQLSFVVPVTSVTGHKDLIVSNLQKMERHFSYVMKEWVNSTRHTSGNEVLYAAH